MWHLFYQVYPAWRWFEKQDGIRSLQKNKEDPAPEFYNIYLERPKVIYLSLTSLTVFGDCHFNYFRDNLFEMFVVLTRVIKMGMI